MLRAKYYFTLLLLFSRISVYSQIPNTLINNWQKAGLDNSYSPPTTVIDITTLGAIPNDGLDDYPSLQAIFSSFPTNGLVIYFPNGTYNFSSEINLPSNCTLQGSGADSTHFIFDLGGTVANCFNFIGTSSSSFFSVSGGLSKGSNQIIVAGASSLFALGNRIEMREQNGSWDTNPASWAAYSIGHISTIDSIHLDTIFMREALRIDYDTTLHPEVRSLNCIENSSLECFQFTRVDSLAPSINYGIYFYNAYNCRVRGVESFKSIGAHCWAEASAHLEISQCYFHEAYTYDGNNTRGYGAIMAVHTVSSLIENNIFQKLRHAMMVKQGANGNVFAYNYSTTPTRTEFPTNAGADICLHGHYPFANLFEGNICQNLSIDQAFGPNGHDNAFFRNRIELYGLIMSSGTIQSDQQLIIGNDIPNTGFLLGNYIIYGVNQYQQSNRVRGAVVPSGTSILLDSSFYLIAKPSFWKPPLSWPSIGIPTLQSTNQNPAAKRFLQGIPYTICGLDTNSTATVLNEINPTNDLKITSLVFENGMLNINWVTNILGNYRITLIDINGKFILKKSVYIETMKQFNSFKINVALGQYQVCIQNADQRVTKKLVVVNAGY